MAFLPIIERELLVAARRKGTHRVRFWTTLIGLVVSSFFLLSSTIFSRLGPMGGVLFATLTYYTFGMCLLAGVFLSADCLSEEKREGTMGLLFLTDLKGHDVVLGKLVGVGLTTLYGLVAIFPVTALPLLMGGVTWNEYCRMALALINALFISLSVGIWVSSRNHESSKAMSNTLSLLLAITLVPTLIGMIMPRIQLPNAWWYAISFNPVYPFFYGFETNFAANHSKYWVALSVSHLTGWFFLFLSSWTLPRTWQEEPLRRKPSSITDTGKSPSENAGSKRLLRGQSLEINPVFWLLGDNPGLRRRVWALVIIGWAVVVTITVLDSGGMQMLSNYINRLLSLLFKILVTVQACRFFVDSRRSGALELLLCTPLTSREIVKGQWLAMKRLFLLPAILFFGIQILPMVYKNFFYTTMFGAFGRGASFFVVLQVSLHIAKQIADIFAIGSVGMWLSLSTKKPNLAVALTVLFVLILPSFLFCIPDITDLVIDIILIAWAGSRLSTDFRSLAAQQYESAPLQPTPPPQTVPNVPPVIG